MQSPGQRLKVLAEVRNENPYFTAYTLATGVTKADYKFILWNDRRWHETAEREGFSLERPHARRYFDEHLETLGALVADSLPSLQADLFEPA